MRLVASFFGLTFFLSIVSQLCATTTFTVTNTANSGAGSLAQAITDCNNNPGDDIIVFNIPGTGGHIIFTSGSLPAITSNITFLNDRPGDDPVIVRPSSAGSGTNFTVNAGNTVTFAGLTINYAGIGISVTNAAVTVRNCTIAANAFHGISHSASNNVSSTLTLLNSTIYLNTAVQGGGISQLASSGGSVHTTVTNCTFDSNSSSNDFTGAAIDTQDNGAATSTLKLVNCTLSNNPSQAHGGTLYNINCAVQAINTIFVHGGSGVNIVNAGATGSFTSLGHNLSDLAEGGDAGTGPGGLLNATGDKRNTNPLLGTLQDNSGLTLTRALPFNSPAVDAGDDAVLNAPYNLTTDQRGAGRKLGAHVDMGAYEREPVGQSGPNFVVTTTAVHEDGFCGAVDCTLLEAVNAANASADANTITFLPGLNGTISSEPTGSFFITHPLTIVGPGARLLTLDGASGSRIFSIQAGAGNVTISDLTLDHGNATGNNFPANSGGAIYNAAFLTLNRCSIKDCAASLLGGGIYNDGQNSNASLTMMDCFVYDNFANASGGAIFNAGYTGHAAASLTNCTVSDNTALQYGGAIYSDGTLSGNASLTLTNCTFYGNSSEANVGGSINNDASNPDSSGIATVILRNNIFKILNTGSAGANLFNDGGTLTSQGHNLSDDNAGGDTSTLPGGYLNATGDKRNTDPQLASTSGPHGGPTDTILFTSANSPAINAGDDALAPSHDQRSYARAGVSDMGAYEWNGTFVPVTVVSRKVHGAAGIFDIPLPLTGPGAVECRNNTGGDPASSPNFGHDHEVVIRFGSEPFFSGVSVSTNMGEMPAVISKKIGDDLVLDLSNVPNARQLTISVTGASDGFAPSNITIPMGVLLGDATANRSVNASDVSQVKSKSGQTIDATNFRTDFTLNGSINSSDVALAKSKSGTALPPAAPARPAQQDRVSQ
jgi:predicted outer membrane repeat protein